MENNPIYDFLKANNLTSKDESSFISEYSDPAKAKELHGFFVQNNLTTKKFDDFYGEYFDVKKKDQQIPYGGQAFGGKEEKPLLPLTSSTVSLSVSSQPKSTTPSVSTEGVLKGNKTTAATPQDFVKEIQKASDKAIVETAPEEPSFGNELFESARRGSAALGGMIANTPSFIYTLAAYPQNKIAEMTGLPIGTTAAQLGETLGIPENEVANYYEDFVKQSQAKVQQKYDKGVTEYLFGKNPDYEKGFKLLANQVVEAAPISISMMMGNAAGVSALGSTLGGGVVFGAGKMQELEGKPMSESEKVENALSTGLLEGVFEQFGVSKLGSVIANIYKKEGKDAAIAIAEKGFKDVFLPALKKYVGIGAEESIGEAATQWTQNWVTILSGEDPNLDPMKGVVDAATVGLGSSIAFSSPTAVAEVLSYSKDRQKAKEIIEKKAKIEQQIANPQTSNEAKTALSSIALDLNEEATNIYDSAKKQYEAIPEEGKQEIRDLLKSKNELEVAMQDPTLDESVKKDISDKIAELDNTFKEKVDLYSNQIKQNEDKQKNNEANGQVVLGGVREAGNEGEVGQEGEQLREEEVAPKTKEFFHGGRMDLEGDIFLTPNEDIAKEYASNNQGKVQSFSLNENKIIQEDEVRDIIKELGIEADTDYMLHELLDSRFDTALSKSDIDKIKAEVQKRGYDAISYNDEDITGKSKAGVESIMVLNKESLSKAPVEKTETPKQPKAKEGSLGVGGDVEFTAKGGNTIVDEKGEPITLLHGTNNNKIKFNEGTVFYATNDKQFADVYGENHLPVKISLKNPYDLTNSADGIIKDKNGEPMLDEKGFPYSINYIDETVVRDLKSRGFDGVRMGNESVVAFDKSQIKAVEQSLKETPKAEVASPEAIETGRQEVSAVKKGKVKTTNPIRLFKGLFGKRNPDGTRKTAHPGTKGVFSAIDEKTAERYVGEDGMGTFDIPAGTTIEVIRLPNRGTAISKFRQEEVDAINASDAQIVKLITMDAKGAEEQYIIKDPALIEKMQKPEEAKKENVGYRQGDLGKKAENLWKMSSEDRSTGHFGTGYYFFGKKENAEGYEANKRGVTKINLDNYNLAKGTKELHALLKRVNEINSKTKDADVKNAVKGVMEYLGLFPEEPKMSKNPTDAEWDALREYNKKKDELIAPIAAAVQKQNERLKTENIDTLGENAESLSTVLMKALGYEGIDSRGTELDNSRYGSVVYDIKPEGKQKFTDNVLKIAEETGLSPQEVERTYVKYEGAKNIEDITTEDYLAARITGDKVKMGKAFDALLQAEKAKESVSPTVKKNAEKTMKEADKAALKQAAEIMEHIDKIQAQLQEEGVIEAVHCKWGK